MCRHIPGPRQGLTDANCLSVCLAQTEDGGDSEHAAADQARCAKDLRDDDWHWLTDNDWLYGSDRQSIHDQIWFGRGGVMPAWGARLDAASIKAVTVYVHVNSGGAVTAPTKVQ